MSKQRIIMLVESALLIGLSTVLSIVKLFEMPYGGSITAFSMVPVAIIAIRYGTKWGLLSGFVNSLIQLLLGVNNLSYATSALAAVAIIMLDYVFAFSFTGLAGVFRKQIKHPGVAAAAGVTLVCVIRYIFHVISGCTVWAGVSIPTAAALVYSLSYNATYMIPETIINVMMAYWICSTLDFSSEHISRLKSKEKTGLTAVFSSLSLLSIAAGVIIDAVLVFSPLQNPESGELDFALMSGVNTTALVITSVAAVLLCLSFMLCATLSKKRNLQ